MNEKAVPNEAKTIPIKRVRILVAINPEGQWSCCGGSHCDEGHEKEWIFLDDMNEGEHYYWVEADVPIPNNEIKGTLTGELIVNAPETVEP